MWSFISLNIVKFSCLDTTAVQTSSDERYGHMLLWIGVYGRVGGTDATRSGTSSSQHQRRSGTPWLLWEVFVLPRRQLIGSRVQYVPNPCSTRLKITKKKGFLFSFSLTPALRSHSPLCVSVCSAERIVFFLRCLIIEMRTSFSFILKRAGENCSFVFACIQLFCF